MSIIYFKCIVIKRGDIINTKIIGTGHYVPKYVLTNDELSTMVDTDDDWIVRRTGIKERRISIDENNVDLAYNASILAIEDCNIDVCDIDLILVGTMSPDFLTPSVSSVLQGKLSAKNAAAMDINVACSGFTYALDVADSYIKSGKAKNILLVCSENLSRVTDFSDRNTCILFADGAGAVVLTASNEEGLISSFLASEGENWEHLTCGEYDKTHPFNKKNNVSSKFWTMSGSDVLRFAVKAVPKAINEVLSRAKKDIKEIDWIIPHQANIRIIDNIIKNYGLSEDKVCVNLNKYGNTSSASIPICLDEYIKNGKIKVGDLALFVGFGGGLSYGSVLIRI